MTGMSASAAEFTGKFIGYVDVLGFTKLVRSAEAGDGMKLPALLDLLKHLGTAESRNHYVKHGPHICPQAAFIQRDLDFRITQLSDCVVVSAEISPAGVVNLVGHCWAAVLELLLSGIMCRGYISKGSIYHTGDQVIGSGYNRAFAMEKHGISAFRREADERGTPFVEIDQAVCDYVNECGDGCVREMFSRQVESDGSVTALFPFKNLSHKFMISPRLAFDPVKEKRSVQNVRTMLGEVKAKVGTFVDPSDSSAVSKSAHYIAALDRQLEVCDRTDEIIDRLAAPFPAKR
jgi:hypothetical protein